MKVKLFGYDIKEVFPLSRLADYSEHRRLKVFFNKGTKCVSCTKVGTKLALGISRSGSSHVDVYTDDMYPMTIDHIIPRSRGGSDNLDNLQPMCYRCNQKKGNRMEGDEEPEKIARIPKHLYTRENIQIGDEIWTRSKKRYFKQGVVRSFCINPYSNKPSVLLDNGTSMHDLGRVHKIVDHTHQPENQTN